MPLKASQMSLSPLPSFRRRPESSGLHKPFPPSGNDNPTPHAAGLAQADAACTPPNILASFSWIPAFAGMTMGQD